MGVGFGVFLDGFGGAAVGIAFAEDGVDGGAFDFVVARLVVGFLVVGGLVGVVREGVAFALELGDAGLELGEGGGDVGELDDVGLGGLGEVTQLGEGVGDALVLGEDVGELGDDAAGEGDVAGLDLDAGGLDEALDEREERIGGESGGFVGVSVADLGPGGSVEGGRGPRS